MLQPLVHNTDAAPAPTNLFSDNISDMPQVEEEEDQQHKPPPKPAKEWTEAVYTFQDVQTQANLCTWTGALKNQGLRLIDIMDVRTLTKFISKSMGC